ncbi:MAG: hypothetical protein AAGF12_40135 [Myxococcota bacterium]
MQIRWIIETDATPVRALATGHYLFDRVRDEGAPVILYGASIKGDALVLGRHQRADDAVHATALEDRGLRAIRRQSGGPAAMLGRGIVYVALCLRHGSVLTDCPRDRLLNRNVRGVLGGLALTGLQAHYFGRQWISVSRRPAGLVGWDRNDGAVLLEFFIGASRNFAPDPALIGYPEPKEAPFGGKEPIQLTEAWEEEKPVTELIRAIAEGHLDRFEGELELDQSSLSDEEREAAKDCEASTFVVGGDLAEAFLESEDVESTLPGRPPMVWSRPREIPIGFVSGGIRLDDDDRIEGARIAGDFYCDREAIGILSDRLQGQEPKKKIIAQALESTFDGNSYVLEGIKDLAPVVDALAEAGKR